MIKRIVLTGGPCAGKSTALSKLESYLLEKGYVVLIVPESATELIQGGIRPFGDQALYGLDFQGIILDYQLAKEKSYDQAAHLLEASGRNVVILYDRGVLDNKAYLDEPDWRKLLTSKNLKEEELKNRYDAVIHMVTAARGENGIYTLENNTARTESKEEAILLDQKTLQAWSGHSNLRVVENAENFSDKVDNVLDFCLEAIGLQVAFRNQKKYIVDADTVEFMQFQQLCSKSNIHQFYLDYPESPYEFRIRNTEIDQDHYYTMTVQEKLENGTSRLIQKRNLSPEEYLGYLENTPVRSSVKKTRYTILYQSEYVRLDIFENGFVLMEVEPMTKNGDIIIPSEISVLEDVSNRSAYQNRVLAKKFGLQNQSA